jgi:uncharacterized protein YggE
MLSHLILSLVLVAAPVSAMAQPAPQRYGLAPWWMAQPIIASTGHVQTEIPANRADFKAAFQVIDRSPQEATRKAADKVRGLVKSLSTYGVQRVRVETSVSMRPIYEQYRDKEGNLISNQRSDKIDTYAIDATVSVEVRDTSLLEQVYAMVLAAGPTSTGAVYFQLEPSNEVNTRLYADAVADAVRRAKLSVEATGVHLGPVKLIDPTGRACQTDVLVAGAPEGDGESFPAQIQPRPPVESPTMASPPPPAPQSEGAASRVSVESMKLALQPPLQKLESTVCVVFGLGV